MSCILRVEHALEYGHEPKAKDVKALCEEYRELDRQLKETLARCSDWRELERFMRVKAAAPSLDLDVEIMTVLRRLRPK